MLPISCHSKASYDQLKRSDVLCLPSGSSLQVHKNSIQQKPGINQEMFLWMHNEAERKSVEQKGELSFDEIYIQENIHMKQKKDGSDIVGFVDLGEQCELMRSISDKEKSIHTANHVLQFVYSTYDNFRFPIAYYPTTGATCQELYILLWQVIGELTQWDFETNYVTVDGANANRTLWTTLLGSSRSSSYKITNLHAPSKPLILIMDPSHVIKWTCNCINSSGFSKYQTHLLCLQDKFIVWDHWNKAYQFDKEKNSGMRVHPKLTDDHIFLSGMSKMRVHLAEECLNQDMLNLMQDFAQSCLDSSEYDSSIQLLKYTSQLIENVRSTARIHDCSHPILITNKGILQFFSTWESEVN